MNDIPCYRMIDVITQWHYNVLHTVWITAVSRCCTIIFFGILLKETNHSFQNNRELVLTFLLHKIQVELQSFTFFSDIYDHNYCRRNRESRRCWMVELTFMHKKILENSRQETILEQTNPLSSKEQDTSMARCPMCLLSFLLHAND